MNCHLLADQEFSLAYLVNRNTIECPSVHREQGRDLFGHRDRLKLMLLQDLPYTPSPFQTPPCVIIQPGPEAGETLQLLELRIGDAKVTGYCPVCRQLGLPPDP